MYKLQYIDLKGSKSISVYQTFRDSRNELVKKCPSYINANKLQKHTMPIFYYGIWDDATNDITTVMETQV